MIVLKLVPKIPSTLMRIVVSDSKNVISRSSSSVASPCSSMISMSLVLSRQSKAFDRSIPIVLTLSAYCSTVALIHCIVHMTSVALRPLLYACCPGDRKFPTLSCILSRTIVDSALRDAASRMSGLVFDAMQGFFGLLSGIRCPSLSSWIVSCLSKIWLVPLHIPCVWPVLHI